jgi:thioredoxin 1
MGSPKRGTWKSRFVLLCCLLTLAGLPPSSGCTLAGCRENSLLALMSPAKRLDAAGSRQGQPLTPECTSERSDPGHSIASSTDGSRDYLAGRPGTRVVDEPAVPIADTMPPQPAPLPIIPLDGPPTVTPSSSSMAAGLPVLPTPSALAQPALQPSSVARLESGPASEPAKARVIHANQASFDRQVLDSDVPVLVDFYASWCGPCKMLAPTLDELAAESPNAKIVKVNIDDSPELANRYGVASVPRLIAFKNGQVVAQHSGIANKSRLKAMLDL